MQTILITGMPKILCRVPLVRHSCPSVKFPSKFGTHLLTHWRDERLSQPCPARESCSISVYAQCGDRARLMSEHVVLFTAALHPQIRRKIGPKSCTKNVRVIRPLVELKPRMKPPLMELIHIPLHAFGRKWIYRLHVSRVTKSHTYNIRDYL
ncbi:hypothetical protein TNCV_536521 [Trichonephila clavipes]|nr:hypothetical protein TNCV_536521 [Trichonephila clavipes]